MKKIVAVLAVVIVVVVGGGAVAHRAAGRWAAHRSGLGL